MTQKKSQGCAEADPFDPDQTNMEMLAEWDSEMPDWATPRHWYVHGIYECEWDDI
jgi:hypothetical protein